MPRGGSWRLASLAALAVLALADRGAADEPAPFLRELQLNGQKVTEVPRGGVVTVVGDGLHACPPLPERVPGQPPPRNTCRHEELSVSLGGEPRVLILDGDRHHLTLIVLQDVRPGRHALVVSVRGRGSAAIDVDVVEPVPDSPGDAGSDQPPEPFRISRFEVEATGAVLVEATARSGRLASGASLLVTFWLHERTLDAREVGFQDGVATVRFGPFEHPLQAGHYSAMALFELSKQSAAWPRGNPLTPHERSVLQRTERREFLTVGTEADLRRQLSDVRAHYLARANDLEHLRAELDGWRAARFLAAMRLPLGARPPALDVSAFERWVATRFGPDLDRVRRAELEFDRRYAFPLSPAAHAHLERLQVVLARWVEVVSERLRSPARPPAVESDPALRTELDEARSALLRAAGAR